MSQEITSLKPVAELKILVVEDDPDMSEMLRYELQHYGHMVIEAPNGNKAVEILSVTKDIDLVITDIRMQGGGGLELVDHIEKLDSKNSPKVIVITGFADPKIFHAKRKGVVALLTKPFSRTELQEIISKIAL